jgi:hypothetical protein
LPQAEEEKIAREILVRLRSRPADDQLRPVLARVLRDMAPEAVAAERWPITGEEDALGVMRATLDSNVAYKTPPKALRRLREEAADRVDAWMKHSPVPSGGAVAFRLKLAWLYLSAERYEACLAILDVPPEELEEEWHRVQACTLRGRALAGLHRFDEAQAALKWAVDNIRPATSYGELDGDTIRRCFAEVWWMPRRNDLRIRTVFLRGITNASGDPRQWGPREFAADTGFRLWAGDPLSEEDRLWATMSQYPRDFAALDEHRVFVALKDRTAALYEEGKDPPRWKRPFALAPESYLSAGPAVITAAEEDGTLHAMDPATGKTLWTRKVKVSAWMENSYPARMLVRQAEGSVLVPDQPAPTQLEWVDAATGIGLWTVRPDAALGQVAIGKDLVVLGGGSGRVTALKCETGKPAWEAEVCPKFVRADYRMALGIDPAGRRVYAAVDGTVWALDAADGHQLWQWKWQARRAMNPPTRPYKPVPKLYPIEDGLLALVNWSEEIKEGASPMHTDVVRFAADGKVALHETSPSDRGAFGAFIAGNRLGLRKGTGHWEIWELLPAAP